MEVIVLRCDAAELLHGRLPSAKSSNAAVRGVQWGTATFPRPEIFLSPKDKPFSRSVPVLHVGMCWRCLSHVAHVYGDSRLWAHCADVQLMQQRRGPCGSEFFRQGPPQGAVQSLLLCTKAPRGLQNLQRWRSARDWKHAPHDICLTNHFHGSSILPSEGVHRGLPASVPSRRIRASPRYRSEANT